MNQRNKPGPRPKDPQDRRTHKVQLYFSPRQVKAAGGEIKMRERMERAALDTSYTVEQAVNSAASEAQNKEK